MIAKALLPKWSQPMNQTRCTKHSHNQHHTLNPQPPTPELWQGLSIVHSATSPHTFSSLVHSLLQMSANNEKEVCPQIVDRSGFQPSGRRALLHFNLSGVLKYALLCLSCSDHTILSAKMQAKKHSLQDAIKKQTTQHCQHLDKQPLIVQVCVPVPVCLALRRC